MYFTRLYWITKTLQCFGIPAVCTAALVVMDYLFDGSSRNIIPIIKKLFKAAYQRKYYMLAAFVLAIASVGCFGVYKYNIQQKREAASRAWAVERYNNTVNQRLEEEQRSEEARKTEANRVEQEKRNLANLAEEKTRKEKIRKKEVARLQTYTEKELQSAITVDQYWEKQKSLTSLQKKQFWQDIEHVIITDYGVVDDVKTGCVLTLATAHPINRGVCISVDQKHAEKIKKGQDIKYTGRFYKPYSDNMLGMVLKYGKIDKIN